MSKTLLRGLIKPSQKPVSTVVKSKPGRKKKQRGAIAATPDQKAGAKKAGLGIRAFKKLPPKEQNKWIKEAKEAKKVKVKAKAKETPKSSPLTPKQKRELSRLTEEQTQDIKAQQQGRIPVPQREKRKEQMTREQRENTTQLERDVGVGSGPQVSSDIMGGKAMTKGELEELLQSGYLSLKHGGIVKRNRGGSVRGVGAAQRGFGNARYSNKLY